MAETALKIKNLSIGFNGPDGFSEVVRKVNIKVKPGQIVGLVGESGSGKSITATACLGLNGPSASCNGTIDIGAASYNAMDIKGLARVRGREVCMIFQNPMNAFNPVVKIGKLLNDIIRQRFRVSKPAARRMALTALKSVHMPDPELKLTSYPHQLSGGQLQRMMIAAAIACQPKLLIADEPTTALDVTVQGNILELIQEMTQATGMGVLFISHDLAVVAKICQWLHVMKQGEIVESGPIERVLRQPQHAYTQRLIQSIPELGNPEKLTQSEGS